ncbi:MAG: uroporphyrinogen decarboxylase family protein [Dehalococcoidales bacterium]|nr:uroporphyrinogen decarboxylase family protein [Dehalococcoidales bacterium]
MTSEEKRQYRLNKTLDTSVMKFPTPEAEKAYKIRQQRMVDVYNVKEPDRVPVNLPVGNIAMKMYGITAYDAMYNPEKAYEAAAKFNEKYGAELEANAMPWAMPGKVLDLLDYKLYAWPGHGLAKDGSSWQFKEGEYMTADEYGDLIRDPSDFWIRKYLPRAFGTFAPMGMFQPFTNITENVHVMQFMPLAMPAVQEMLQKLIDVGKEFQNAMQLTAKAMSGMNMPNTMSLSGVTFAKAPFDILGDTLRGTTGIMKDTFRYPDKLLKALDVVADFQINTILNSPNIANMLIVTYPLHKGADGWMSQKSFDTFYWPSLKKVMDALINEGLIQSMFAEGSFDTRLKYVDQFPKGSVLWYFDRTDIFNAKKLLGHKYCLQGNIPTSMLVMADPKDVKEYCRKLIQEVGKGGGYILSAGATPDNPKLENLQAIMEAVREYGFYKK